MGDEGADDAGMCDGEDRPDDDEDEEADDGDTTWKSIDSRPTFTGTSGRSRSWNSYSGGGAVVAGDDGSGTPFSGSKVKVLAFLEMSLDCAVTQPFVVVSKEPFELLKSVCATVEERKVSVVGVP